MRLILVFSRFPFGNMLSSRYCLASTMKYDRKLMLNLIFLNEIGPDIGH